MRDIKFRVWDAEHRKMRYEVGVGRYGLNMYGLTWAEVYGGLTVKGALDGVGTIIPGEAVPPYADEENGVVFSEKAANSDEEE